MRRSISLLTALGLLATAPLLTWAQEGEGGRRQTYESPYGFRLRLPASWTRSHVGRAIGFRSPDDSGRDLPTLAIKVVPSRTDQNELNAEIEALIAGVEEATATLEEEGLPPELQLLEQDEIEIDGSTAYALTWEVVEPRATLWEVYSRLPNGSSVILSFSSTEDDAERSRSVFRSIARSLAQFDLPEADEGYRRISHPLGMTLQIPETWIVEQEDYALFCLPLGHEKETYPISIYLTAPIPEAYDSLEKIQEAIESDLEAAGLDAEISDQFDLGGEDAWIVTWRVPDRREWTTQIGAIWQDTLVAVTLSADTEDLANFEPIFDRVLETLTLR